MMEELHQRLQVEAAPGVIYDAFISLSMACLTDTSYLHRILNPLSTPQTVVDRYGQPRKSMIRGSILA